MTKGTDGLQAELVWIPGPRRRALMLIALAAYHLIKGEIAVVAVTQRQPRALKLSRPVENGEHWLSTEN